MCFLTILQSNAALARQVRTDLESLRVRGVDLRPEQLLFAAVHVNLSPIETLKNLASASLANAAQILRNLQSSLLQRLAREFESDEKQLANGQLISWNGALAPFVPMYSGLADPALDDLLERSPTLVRQIAQIRRLGWSIEPGPANAGTWADVANKRIVIDTSAPMDKYATLVDLAHEVHHALYDHSVARTMSSKEAFVRGQMASEGASAVNEVEVLLEVALNSNVRIPDQALENIVGPLSIYARYVDHKDYNRLIREIGALFEHVRTSIGERYRPYYERLYDQLTVDRTLTRSQTPNQDPSEPRGPHSINLPANRPLRFDLEALPRTNVGTALVGLESNNLPLSSADEPYPADPVFRNLFAQLDLLGSHTLRIGEIGALIQLNNDWMAQQKERIAAQRNASPLYSPATLPTGYLSMNRTVLHHDLHVLLAGFRRVPDSLYLLEGKEYQSVARIQPGMGGEGGIYATVTGRYASRWGEQHVIRRVLQEQIPSAMNARQRLAARVWAMETEKLVNAPSLSRTDPTLENVAPSLPKLLGRYADMGFFANPRFLEAARPVLAPLLASAPGSTQRQQAAQALVALFRQEEQRLETLSLSSVTAEVQLTEAMYQYLSARAIDLSNADRKIDWNDFYTFYKQQAEVSHLTTRDTVRQWLASWQVPFGD